MQNVKLIDHPLVQHKLSLMRDVTTGSKEFRELVSEVAMLMSYEATRDLPLTTKEIETPLDLLSWDYYQYVREHSRYHWDFPTYILYGAKDNLQSLPVMKRFADRYGCQLSVSENSEHPFMAKEDIPIVANWMREHI